MKDMKEYHREYYKNNREKMLSRAKKRIENYTSEEKAKWSGYQKAYRKSYYRDNREKILEKARERYKKSVESPVTT